MNKINWFEDFLFEEQFVLGAPKRNLAIIWEV